MSCSRRCDGNATRLVGVRRRTRGGAAGVRAQVGPVAAVPAARRRAGPRRLAARVRRPGRRDRQVQVRTTTGPTLLTLLVTLCRRARENILSIVWSLD